MPVAVWSLLKYDSQVSSRVCLPDRYVAVGLSPEFQIVEYCFFDFLWHDPVSCNVIF